MLNKPLTNVTSLLNTKLDCRKPDGSVDEELSRAFQEACFAQGIFWEEDTDTKIQHLNAPFLFAESDSYLGYVELRSEEFFNRPDVCKQINFTYTRKLEWEATIVETKAAPTPEPVDEMVSICGVEYSAKELSEALALIKSARK